MKGTRGIEKIFSMLICINIGGSFILAINSRLLKSKISFFQYLSYLGYCNFTLCISAAIKCVWVFAPKVLLIVIDFVLLFWTMIIMARFLRVISEPQKYWLNFFPTALYFLFLFTIGTMA
jgi:hypothetical protein